MKVHLTPRYIAAFLFLTMLCGTSHEFVHHFTAAAICGCFGYKTFNSFEICQGCENAHPMYYWATLAGPLFTYALMWVGMFQLRKQDHKNKLLGFALIFANFPINRIAFALMGWNDEQWVARLIYPSQSGFWITNLLIWACTLPPLYWAYKSLANDKWRLITFLGFLILPFVFVIVFAGFFLEEWLLLKLNFLITTVWGIPYLIMLCELICLAGYFKFKKYLYQEN